MRRGEQEYQRFDQNYQYNLPFHPLNYETFQPYHAFYPYPVNYRIPYMNQGQSHPSRVAEWIVGLAGLVGAYILYEGKKYIDHKEKITACLYAHPYQFGQIETCLKGWGVPEADAMKIADDLDKYYRWYAQTKKFAVNPSGEWDLTLTTGPLSPSVKKNLKLSKEGIARYTGDFCCDPPGKLWGHMFFDPLAMQWQLNGEWYDNYKVDEKPTSGKFYFYFSLDDNGIPLLKGTFGYGMESTGVEVTGRQIREFPEQ